MNHRELKSLLRRRGYTERAGKGSHSIWTHPQLPGKPIVLCGRNHEDVPPYQVARVYKGQHLHRCAVVTTAS